MGSLTIQLFKIQCSEVNSTFGNPYIQYIQNYIDVSRFICMCANMCPLRKHIFTLQVNTVESLLEKILTGYQGNLFIISFKQEKNFNYFEPNIPIKIYWLTYSTMSLLCLHSFLRELIYMCYFRN